MISFRLSALWLGVLCALFSSFLLPETVNADAPLSIKRITPQGMDVPAKRQIVIKFNQPVVPLGRMERSSEEIPIEITPPLACQWRWLNTSSLACQLANKKGMAPSTRYTLKINPGIVTEKGTGMTEPVTHEFITERPRIRYAWFDQWQGPGTPTLRVTFNQPISRASVADHLYIETGDKARHVLRVEPDPNRRKLPRYIRVPGESYYMDLGEGKTESPEDPPIPQGADEARRFWLITPVKPLPHDMAASLNVEPGLESALGPEKGITKKVVQKFHTFANFAFTGVRCQDNRNQAIVITAKNFEAAGKKCNPLAPAALLFNAPVLSEEIKKHALFTPDLAGGRKDYDPWANASSYSNRRGGHNKGQEYAVYFPELLRAAQEYRVQIETGTLQDEFGRALEAPVSFRFFTDHRNPDFTLTHKTAVLEKQVDTDVPLVVTNLDKIELDFKKTTASGSQENLKGQVPVEPARDVAYALPLGARNLLNGQSGAVYATVHAQPSVKKNVKDRTLFAVVSPWQVQVKVGHFNTLVWVMDFQTGEPVPGARIRIYKDTVSALSKDKPDLDTAITDEHGAVVLKGTSEIDPQLKAFKWGYFNDELLRLVVSVEKEDDRVVLPLDQSRFGVDIYRASEYSVYPNQQKEYGHIHTWGTTAQGIYRAGDTIQYKIYVRHQDNDRFIAAPEKSYQLEIIDPTGKTVHSVKELSLSAFGAFDGEYTVPETAAVGWYQFKLKANFAKHQWQPMRVLVSDFTPSPFRVESELNGTLFQPENTLEISSGARLHSGGAFPDAPVRVTVNLQPFTFRSKHPLAKSFNFSGMPGKEYPHNILQVNAKLDSKGNHQVAQALSEIKTPYAKLDVESAVRDDRGKNVAARSSATFVGVNRFVGLRNTKWVYDEDQPAEVLFITVNEKGEPVGDTPVSIAIERLVTKASRVKGAGNAYLTEFVDQWLPAGTCSAQPQGKAESCFFTPQEPGSWRLTATITDTRGRQQQARQHLWVAGKGQIVWRENNSNTLKMIPEAESYKVGDTARFLIQNPFPGRKALITVERYGVLKHWVQTFETGTPIVEVPIEADFVPGFYLSVTVLSPRVEQPLKEGVDLGKPAYRIGYAMVPVVDPYKELQVKLLTDREVYKPRETVKVSLQAEPRHPGKPEPMEIAVAVLDESVLDLLADGTGAFDPYQGFYHLDGLDLQNFSLMERLIGRQKFEKKGANTGGDGGADFNMRSLFKFVSYWNPAIALDKQGRAKFEFEVPDNLTGWRILAMAVTPTDRMGLGQGNFKVNRSTEIRPVLPNQVTEGDRFDAGFSVMNRTDKARTLQVSLQAEGDLDADSLPASTTETLHLEAFKRQTVYLPVQSRAVENTRKISEGEIRFKVTAVDALDGDGLTHSLPVRKRRGLDTAANYGTTLKDQVTESILLPKHIHTDVGSIRVITAPSVLGNLEGAFRYMKNYPYTCWEQILSQGVMAAFYKKLRPHLDPEFQWDEAGGLPDRTLSKAASFQAPNGGMVYFLPQNHYVSPYLSAYTALAFNWMRGQGYTVPEEVERKLHDYLIRLLKKNVAPGFYSRGMASTVRAVALAALAPHDKVNLSDLDRYRNHLPDMSLFGRTHFLDAALHLKADRPLVLNVTESILAHANESAGKFQLTETLDDGYRRLLATPLRSNCAVLSSMTRLVDNPEAKALVGEIAFQMVRFITQTRGKRDHWENTQENVFCMNALADYSHLYENTPPKMKVTARLQEEVFGDTEFKKLIDPPITFERPIGKDDPGKQQTMTLERKGTGRLYYATQVQFAPLEDHAERQNAGLDIRREYSVERDGKWTLMKKGDAIQRGELVRVDLFVSLPAARNFVVVDDPVPGGLEPVNRDLATASTLDANKGAYQAAGGSWWFQFDDWQHYAVSRWNFYHQEIRHHAVRYYSDYLPAGNYHLSYTAQAIATGTFSILPVHTEEMYDPDVFGKGLPAQLQVNPDKS